MKRWMRNLLLAGGILIVIGMVTAAAAGVAGGMRLSHKTLDHFLDRVEDAVEDELFHDEDEWWDFDHEGGHRGGGCMVFLNRTNY